MANKTKSEIIHENRMKLATKLGSRSIAQLKNILPRPKPVNACVWY
jgi:hypothetical protein